MNEQDWRNDETLKQMDTQKLAFLNEMVKQTASKSPGQMLPFLLASTANASKQGIQFSDAETDLILRVLKERMSPQEQSRIETLRKMANQLSRQK